MCVDIQKSNIMILVIFENVFMEIFTMHRDLFITLEVG